MKTTDEMTANVFRRRDETLKLQRQRRKKMRAVAVFCGCGVLAIALSVGIWQKDWFAPTTGVGQPGGEYWHEDELIDKELHGQKEPSKTSQAPDDGEKKIFAVNEIVGVTQISYTAWTPDRYNVVHWSLEQAEEYFGVKRSQIEAVFPAGWNPNYMGKDRVDAVYELESGALVYDAMYLQWMGTEGEIEVIVGRAAPPRDSSYHLKTDHITSVRLRDSGEILSVLVCGAQASQSDSADGEVQSVTIGKYALVVADFEYGGNFYRIVIKDLPLGVLDQLIRAIAGET